jgi:hypothetical protein
MLKGNKIYCDKCRQLIAMIKNPPPGKHVHYKCPVEAKNLETVKLKLQQRASGGR